MTRLKKKKENDKKMIKRPNRFYLIDFVFFPSFSLLLGKVKRKKRKTKTGRLKTNQKAVLSRFFLCKIYLLNGVEISKYLLK